jgi:hypothetical protein
MVDMVELKQEPFESIADSFPVHVRWIWRRQDQGVQAQKLVCGQAFVVHCNAEGRYSPSNQGLLHVCTAGFILTVVCMFQGPWLYMVSVHHA